MFMAIKYGRKKMKDKEKQIQEIAQLICERSKDDICIIDNTSCNSSCYWARKAEAIYNVGYRKLLKDSVVLSREEYKRITTELVTEQRATEIAKEYFEKIRKETAEKWHYHITTTLLALWKGNKITTEVYNSWIVFFNSLAKQFGVEIKE